MFLGGFDKLSVIAIELLWQPHWHRKTQVVSGCGNEQLMMLAETPQLPADEELIRQVKYGSSCHSGLSMSMDAWLTVSK